MNVAEKRWTTQALAQSRVFRGTPVNSVSVPFVPLSVLWR
jgi:hypothetical protein